MQTKVAERNENWMSDKPLVGRPKKDEYLLSVTACLKVRGKYCKGSSRTLVFQGLVWEPQDLLDKVERMVKSINVLKFIGYEGSLFRQQIYLYLSINFCICQ